MYTEAEAAAKWCPLVRTGMYGLNDKAGCVGSRCMMWRWGDPPADPADPRPGYCGLAGKPVEAAS